MRAVIIVLLVTVPVWAITLSVPGDYPTIQAALDALQERDTVLVDSGIYAEALTAPAMSFVLRGNVPVDTGDFPRPLIDPTPLQGSNSLACVNLQGGDSVTLERFTFRNGAAMYPRQPDGQASGVWGWPVHITIRHCRFDSTMYGFISNGALDALFEDCHFVNVNTAICLINRRGTDVRRCRFEHCTGWAHVYSGQGTKLTGCTFDGNPTGYLCDLSGRNLLIQDCVFGPSTEEGRWDNSLNLTYPSGVIENNRFQRLALHSGVIIVQCACNDTDIVEIRHNSFIGNGSDNPGNGEGEVVIQNIDPTRRGRCGARIDSNLFADNHDGHSSKGIYVRGTDATITGNRFMHLHPPNASVPTILADPPQQVVLRGNHFDSTGYAVGFRNGVPDTLDARWNWWGDASGPKSRDHNPNGRGDSVANGVNIFPWCEDSVDCEEPTAAPSSPFFLHPFSFVLSSCPNPFNSTTVLRLQVPHPEIVRIELFNLLGRRVQELWAGVVAEEKEITVDGSALASGIYFVRATETIYNRPLVSAKLVLLK